MIDRVRDVESRLLADFRDLDILNQEADLVHVCTKSRGVWR